MRRLIFIIILAVSESLLFSNDFSDDLRHGSCRFRSVRQAEFDWNSPERSMTESFVLDDVEYKLCRYRVTWDEALVFCSNHESRLAALDTEEKVAFVVRAIASSSSASEDFWIGARKLYDGPWKWSSNGMRLGTKNNIMSNPPIWYPGLESSDVHCLTIDRSGHNDAIFLPRPCNQRRGFVCQRDTNGAFDAKLRMVSATRIGNQEFRLYAGRATWAEAVVQCREEGLQIAEVNTAQEARALAISMLRNRPEGIESTWIGGYTRKNDPSTWRWLGSGEKIDNPDMWRRNTSEISGGCLLLDRHVCESPVYVESTCDRKRDVLCQKPPAKRPSKIPVPVIVDGCPYWIGFHASTWTDARRSCESLNATLVVLDSPATISHMMSLMLDNKAELRHIWTDGRRSTGGKWKWMLTDEEIPDYGKSFVPWCPEDDYDTRENGCLNLDRENLDSPLVYGLSCREKQTYVCQPRTSDCVFRSTSKLLPDAATDISEETPLILYQELARTQPVSTATASVYPTRSLNDVVETTLDGAGSDVDSGDLVAWESSQRESENNSSHGDDFAPYLKPFSRFTLPTLPQFGIKVVSAADATTNPGFETAAKKKIKNKAYKLLTTSSYVTSTAIVTPSSSFTTKKSSSDARKMSKASSKYSNTLVTPPDLSHTTISSVFTESRTEKSTRLGNSTRPTFAQSSPSPKSHLSPKNSSRTSKVTKIVTTPTAVPGDDSLDRSSTSELGRTKKYSIKTTRDLNSSMNVTRIASTTTTTTTTDVPSDDEKPIQSVAVGGTSRPANVDHVSAKRPNSTLVTRRRQHFHVTTEATTPYDAIDEDYYNDDKDDKSTKNKFADEDFKDPGELNEYSEDYDSTPRGKSQKKKKVKKTTLGVIRNPTKRPIGDKEVEEDEPEEEEENNEEEGEEDQRDEMPDTTEHSIPIAKELSKNLEDALVKMMRNGVENRKTEKPPVQLEIEKKPPLMDNVPWVKDAMLADKLQSAVKSSKQENFSLRPYYAFEGPMIVDLSGSPSLGSGAERTGTDGNNVREFKFIGKKMSDESYSDSRRLEARRMSMNETSRRQMKPTPPAANRDTLGNLALSMSGMPPIQPNDPNSLMQLGRYFKNKFRGFAQGPVGNEDRGSQMTREETDQRRYGPAGRPFAQERHRGYSALNREEDTRRKGQRWSKPGMRDSGMNYYDRARRLYPRGNYDTIYGSPGQPGQPGERSQPGQLGGGSQAKQPGEGLRPSGPVQGSQPGQPREGRQPSQLVQELGQGSERGQPGQRRSSEAGSMDQQQERLGVAWPGRNVSNYDENDENVQLSLAVSPRSYPVPVRTTRSFHEAADVGKLDVSTKRRVVPDFKLSKLVKEVKIDLDQRMLRRYLEGFARKMARQNSSGDNNDDDWKDTWRRLLKQMLTVIDRMNINVNGDLMKLRVGVADGNDYNLTGGLPGKSPKLGWKSGLRKQRKDSNVSPKNYSSPLKKPNENLQKNSPVLQKEEKINSRNKIEIKSTDYRRVYNRESVTKNPFGDENIRQTDLPGRFREYKKFASPNRQERPVDRRGNSRQIPNNVFQMKYMNYNNQTASRRPQTIVPVARLSTVFGYRPLMPQLHHRIMFQPGWGQARRTSGPRKPFFNAGYLSKASQPQIVGGEKKMEYFGDDKNDASSTAKPEPNDREKQRLKNSLRDDANEKSVAEWKINERNEVKNKLGTENSSERFEDGKIDREEFRQQREEEIVVEENRPEDYERKPVWLPAHRLTKALELSVLRKFGAGPSGSLRSKNLVTRSVKEIEGNRESKTEEEKRRNGAYSQNALGNLENLDAEPSVVSLRMIVDPETKYSRISRQSQQPRISEENPRTVELRVQFSGKEESAKATTQRATRNNLIQSEIKDQTLQEFPKDNQSLQKDFGTVRPVGNIKDENLNSSMVTKRPIRFVDKERRKAIIERLRERSRNARRNYLRMYAARRQNGTAIVDLRDRKSRNIGAAKKKLPGDAKAEKVSQTKHFIATSLRGFEAKNLTSRGANKWRRGEKKFQGVDWAHEASALFADVKENSDDLTLYIDLTLGRVGSKPRYGGRSKG